MEKYYNEKGQVGVIVSPSFGGGWSTWNVDSETLMFDKELVEVVLKGDSSEIKRIAETLCPDGYFGSFEDLEVEFLEPGTKFYIKEYDGSECIVVYNPEDYFVA